jgi:hypothetical protein
VVLTAFLFGFAVVGFFPTPFVAVFAAFDDFSVLFFFYADGTGGAGIWWRSSNTVGWMGKYVAAEKENACREDEDGFGCHCWNLLRILDD